MYFSQTMSFSLIFLPVASAVREAWQKLMKRQVKIGL
jgi:hypothetical protein